MGEPLRVAQVMGYMNGGGVEQVVMNYYRHVDRARVQFDFIVCEGSGLIPREEIESMGGRVFTVPPYGSLPRYMREIEVLFREQGWPIVHSHVNALSVFPLRAAERADVPVRIASSHSSGGGGKGETVRDLAKGILRRFSTVYPTDLLACSHVAGDWLFGEDADYSVLPNAVDLTRFESDEDLGASLRRSLGAGEDMFVIGHIGRMAPQKNHSFLLEVFREVQRIRPDSLLVLAGDGPLLSDVRMESDVLGLGKSVRFLGQISDVNVLYQAIDVFCLPSVYEDLPVVSIECQASGTPILASDAVTREAAATDLMEFESLDSSPEKWAEHLLSMKRDGKDFNASDMHDFDIDVCAKRLADYYESRLKGAA